MTTPTLSDSTLASFDGRTFPASFSAALQVSEDKTPVINCAKWRAEADMEAMLRSPEAQPHLKSAAELADSYEPVLYTLRLSDGASGAAR